MEAADARSSIKAMLMTDPLCVVWCAEAHPTKPFWFPGDCYAGWGGKVRMKIENFLGFKRRTVPLFPLAFSARGVVDNVEEGIRGIART